MSPISHPRRGAILLEIVLALALFVATAITLLSVVAGSIDSLNRSRDRLAAADHARNAMAMIEAGIARPETLIGPVAPWSGGEGEPSSLDDEFDGTQAGAAPIATAPSEPFGAETGWALEIETEPAETRGLTLVSVRAFRTDESGSEEEGGASFTLRQIMVLSDGASGDPDFGSGFDTGGSQ